ncbi:imelysin family protein [Sessilibacter corallicola]|uniref:imelysin family protein n=1 Tax=Sessilibacter corallicola TaxID=2904075 RepID=UPI001E59382B|nr:imelysin family protein [Sessilibacter corallicola]MCE2030402.1 imelysin family protein [Sessilibacter corallicola]
MSGLFASIMLIAGCDQQSTPESTPDTSTANKTSNTTVADQRGSPDQLESAQSSVNIVNDWINNAIISAAKEIETLSNAGDAFYNTPSEQTLEQLKTAWVNAHTEFSKTAPVFSLAHASPDLFYSLRQWQNLLDAHPVQPGYLDSFDVYTHSGIVNDTLLSINAETIRNQHQLTHSDEIALGFHAIEFLVWGENSNRDLSLFIAEGNDSSAAEKPENRRRELIRLLSLLLLDDFQLLKSQWQKSTQQQLSRLSPLSQAQLWKQAITHFWQEYSVKQIANNDDDIHNPFSGQSFDDFLAMNANTLQGILSLSATHDTSLYSQATTKKLSELITEFQTVILPVSTTETTSSTQLNSSTDEVPEENKNEEGLADSVDSTLQSQREKLSQDIYRLLNTGV